MSRKRHFDPYIASDGTEQPRFEWVRQRIELLGDMLLAITLEEARVAEQVTPAQRASQRAEVILAGTVAFDRLRRLHRDRRAFVWEPHIADAMQTRATELVCELLDDSDDENAGGCNEPDPGPRWPGAPSHGVPAPGVASREGLVRLAGAMAWRIIAQRIGSWSRDSHALEDLHQEAVSKGFSRLERLWDPARSPLQAFLYNSVRFEVQEAFRSLNNRSRREREMHEAVASEESVRIAVWIADCEADPAREGDGLEELVEWVIGALDELSPRQREEVLRRLAQDTAGTNADQLVYSRAVAKLRRLADERDDQAA